MVPTKETNPTTPSCRPLPTVFAEMVALYGERPALSGPDLPGPLSYLQVQAAASRLAVQLSARPEAPPEVCAIFLPTSATHVMAVLGVLQAGQVWLSLDPTYPDERLRLMLAETQPVAILTDATLAGRAAGLAPNSRVIIWQPDVTATPALLLPVSPDPWRPACIFFTSGSTGRPKSAVHTHANIFFDIARQTRDLAISPADRFDLLFSASFSAFLSPVFGALLTGASVHVWPLHLRLMTDLRDWLEDQRITVATMSVSTYRRLVAAPPRHGFPAMRILSIGAEPLVMADYEIFAQRFPRDCLLQNALATTETRTIAQECHPASAPPPSQVTCGRAVDRKPIELRDPTGQPVPVGQAGEIVVISEVISAGDWSFFRDLPQRTLGAARLTVHRTGDAGRFLPDGRLIHLGRLDSQLKVRGHRVEALEVENALLRHPAVANAAVCIIPDAAENAVLTAALITKPGQLPAPSALRNFLLGSLPEYAVPARFVFVPTLPATPSGKLDRKAVPAFIAALPEASAVASAPLVQDGNDPLLDRILHLWSTALNARLQPDDDFFTSGGDSLQAVETMAALQAELNLTLSPGLIVEYSTARRLAAHLKQVSPGETAAVTVRALRSGQPGYFPVYFLPPWNHSCTVFRDLARVPAPGQAHPWFALESFNPAEAIPDSIEQLAARYLPVLSRLHPDTPFCLAGYSAGGFITWEIARQLAAAGRRNVHVILLDCPRMFSQLTPAEAAAEARAKRPWVKMRNLISHAIHPRGLHRGDFIRELLWGKLSWWLHRRHRQAPPDPYAEAYQANIKLSCRYQVIPLSLPVAVVRARFQASWLTRFQADLGWTPFCQGSFALEEVNDSHLNMLYAPGAKSTAETIDRLTAKWAAADSRAPHPRATQQPA